MNIVTHPTPSLLSPAALRALLEEATLPDGDPRSALLAARSVLNLVFVAEERTMANCAPGECALLLLRPWSQLRVTIDARIDALQAKLESMERECCSMAEAV